jgi:hypothetical protein
MWRRPVLQQYAIGRSGQQPQQKIALSVNDSMEVTTDSSKPANEDNGLPSSRIPSQKVISSGELKKSTLCSLPVRVQCILALLDILALFQFRFDGV